MDFTKRQHTQKRNAPIASLQEAYQSISREVAPAAVIGNWALRLSVFDNTSWDTSGIEIALARKPKQGSLKSLIRQGYEPLEHEEHADGSERRTMLKPEKGYSIPVTIVYDKSGSFYTYGIPTSAMFYNSIDMDVPRVRIAGKKIMLSYELLAARSARTTTSIQAEREHAYAAYRLLGELYNLDVNSFIMDLSQAARPSQGVFYDLISFSSMKQSIKPKAAWPDGLALAIIAEEAARLRSLIRDSRSQSRIQG